MRRKAPPGTIPLDTVLRNFEAIITSAEIGMLTAKLNLLRGEKTIDPSNLADLHRTFDESLREIRAAFLPPALWERRSVKAVPPSRRRRSPLTPPGHEQHSKRPASLGTSRRSPKRQPMQS